MLVRVHIGATWRIRLKMCSLGPLESTIQTAIDRFSRFCTAHDRKCLYFAMGAPISRNCPFHEGPESSISARFLGSPNSSTQMISRSLQLFLHDSLVSQINRQSDRQDHATRSLTIDRIYVRSSAIRLTRRRRPREIATAGLT